MESILSVSKLSTESVGSRRELVANCVHSTLDSCVASASAVCIGRKGAITSKIKHAIKFAIKPKASPARLAQLLCESCTFYCSCLL